MKFGRLKVLKLSREIPIGKHSIVYRYWLCQCDCGNTKEIMSSNLAKPSGTKSCGCLQDESRRNSTYNKPGTAFRTVLGGYKTDAKRRGYNWCLTDEQFRELTLSPCHYTGRLPSNTTIAKSGEKYVYNGIDRKDSTKEYTIENCVPCCKDANLMKRDVPYEEFIGLCKEIAERM